MSSPPLQYLAPTDPPFRWRPWIFILIFGPFTGIGVGFAQTTAAVLCWMFHGEPDFYFRGWSNVEYDYFTNVVVGGIVGVGYGVALRIFEKLSRRRIRLAFAGVVGVAISFAAAAAIVEFEFRRHRLDLIFIPELVAIAICFSICALASRRAQ